MHPSVELEQRYGARNYEPLPVTLTRGEGIYVWDDAGTRYIDMMSAYSAVSFGHCHPKIVQALTEQAGKLGVTSRAYFTDKLGPFLQQACELTGQDKALPMNSGAEAVETALKAARKWAYQVKGLRTNKAEIISCEGNFHGRTIAIISMSSEVQYQDGFGPFLPGLRTIHYGKVQDLELAISHNTAAFIVEPIQGEGGIIVPPPGYLKACADICKKNKVLFIADEIQTGMGRTGKMLACDYEGVKPDAVLLGKALGGGMLPVSLFLARKELMNVFQPGDHGSTFGGNPLAAAVGSMAFQLLVDENLIEKAADLGRYFMEGLHALSSPVIREIRGKGLLIGLEIKSAFSAREVCLKMLKHGILTKDTHKTVIRLTPPLVITREQIDEALKLIKLALDEIRPVDVEPDDVEVMIPKRDMEVAASERKVRKRKPKPKVEVKAAEPEPVTPEPEVKAEAAPAPEPEVKVEEAAAPQPEPVTPEPEVKAEEAPVPEPEVKAEEAAAPQPEPVTPEPEVKAEEAPAPEPEVKAEEAAAPQPEPLAPEPEVKAEEAPAPEPEVPAEAAPTPASEPAAPEIQAAEENVVEQNPEVSQGNEEKSDVGTTEEVKPDIEKAP